MTIIRNAFKDGIIFSTRLSLPFHTCAHHCGYRPNSHTIRPSCLTYSLPKVQHRTSRNHKQKFATSSISSILLPPTVYLGLFGALWLYKCLMMVLFQNKIIYMPSIPPFSRREEIETYKAASRPIVWEEKRIKSEDGTDLALCVGEAPVNAPDISVSKQVILLYFQGLVYALQPQMAVSLFHSQSFIVTDPRYRLVFQPFLMC